MKVYGLHGGITVVWSIKRSSYDLSTITLSKVNLCYIRANDCRISGLTKGVGFIRFNLKSEAEAAIKLRSGTVPPGATEPITVKFANQPTISKVTTPLPVQPVATAVANNLKYVQTLACNFHLLRHNINFYQMLSRRLSSLITQRM